MSESDFAITGTTLTTSESFLRTTISIGLSLLRCQHAAVAVLGVSGYERVTGGLDEEQAAVNASVLDVALTLSSELLAEIGGVLILDVFDNGVPAKVRQLVFRNLPPSP